MSMILLQPPTYCRNGHLIIPSKNNSPIKKFCSRCGEKIFFDCPSCHTPFEQLMAYMSEDGHLTEQGARLCYCSYCGVAFPWTQTFIDNAIEIVALADEIPPRDKELLNTAIPDLIIDSPTTPLAEKQLEVGLAKALPTTLNCLRKIFSFCGQYAATAILDMLLTHFQN